MNLVENPRQLQQWLQKYGSPLFVYSEEALLQKANELKQVLGPIEVFYSMKANPTPFVCQVFQEQGLGIEVASMTEMEVALRVGYDPKRVFLTAPSKTWEEMERAVDCDILAINIDNLQEIVILEEIAASKGKTVDVTFRIHQSMQAKSNVGSNMNSKSAQFGSTAEELLVALQQPLPPHLRLIGVHTFQGSQLFNVGMYQESWGQLVELCKQLEKLGHDIRFIGLGGGFGFDIYESKFFDFENFALVVQEFLATHETYLSGKQLMMESGNFLVASSGTYVTTALYTKTRGDNHFVYVDGGTHHIEPESRLGRIFHSSRKVHSWPQRDGNKFDQLIVGCLLSPHDVLCHQFNKSQVQPGDLLLFPNSGAYALTSSRLQFLSHHEPAEIGVYKDARSVVSRKPRSAMDRFCFDFEDANAEEQTSVL